MTTKDQGDAIICAAEPNTDAVDTQPIKARTPIVTHTIMACEVVPGMLLAPGWNIVDVRRDAGELLIAWRDRDVGDAIHYEADEHLVLRLPGPSPRELCCSCDVPRWMIGPLVGSEIAISKFKARDPGQHPAGCPVAPVTAVHGGMRLWPAPVGRVTWAWTGAFFTALYNGNPYWPDWNLRCVLRSDLDGSAEQAGWWQDLVLQAFFLPPTQLPEPDRRIPGASPDDPDLEHVADLVSGGVIGPVRR